MRRRKTTKFCLMCGVKKPGKCEEGCKALRAIADSIGDIKKVFALGDNRFFRLKKRNKKGKKS